MILSTLISFLGGSAFRMVWGEVSAWMTAKQEQANEVERMRLQGELDAATHSRNLESLRLQHDLGIKEVVVKSEADLEKLAAETFGDAVKGLSTQTGFWLIDAWKSAIQPALATLMMVLIALHYSRVNWVLDDRGWELAGAALGLFLADRLLFRRGK